MKIKNILIGLAFSSLALTSCNDWFDVSPSTNIKEGDLFKNEQGFQDVMTGIYQLMTTEVLYGRELSFGLNDIRAQYWEKVTATTHLYTKATNFDYEDAAEVSKYDRIWSTFYKGIANSNAILASIDEKQKVFSKGNYELCKGEALAARAFLHFEVLRMYSDSPVTGMEKPAIPYFDHFTNAPQPQLKMSEVVAKIRKDLIAARDLMREFDYFGVNYDQLKDIVQTGNDRKIKFNYWAVTGLLARLELYIGEKDAAFAYAKEIIGEPEAGPAQPIYLVSTTSTSDKLCSRELLFALDVQKLKTFIEPFFLEGAVSILSTSSANCDKIYKSEGANDAEFRKGLWYQSAGTSTMTLAKYKDEIRIPLLKIAEIYYIAAESAATPELGLAYLNKIRGVRGLSALTDAAKLQNEIKAEYYKEFVGEGQVFYYYKRHNLASIGVSKTKNITPEKVYILPLPKSEIEFGKIQ